MYYYRESDILSEVKNTFLIFRNVFCDKHTLHIRKFVFEHLEFLALLQLIIVTKQNNKE